MLADKRTFIYRIDAADRITHVNEEWLSFAVENGSPALDRKAVINRPLWDFIYGTETKHIYRVIVDRVRAAGLPLSIPFRCDSPELRLFMEMEIVPLDKKAVEFDCALLRTEPRPRMALLDPLTERSDDFLAMCSWCKRIRLAGNEWVEVEEAVKRLNMFEAASLPQLTHGMCGSCNGLSREKLEELAHRGGRKKAA